MLQLIYIGSGEAALREPWFLFFVNVACIVGTRCKVKVEETGLPEYFGEWLKLRRNELDLTQAELAQRAGCSVPTLRKIE